MKIQQPSGSPADGETRTRIPPATERFMANRAHATVSQVKASHVPMISQPGATMKVILAAAKAAA